MLKVVVRSSSDVDAVKACLERFFENLDISVVSAKGLRGPKFWEHVHDITNSDDSFIIILCGKKDYIREEALELDSKPHISVVQVPRANVRNSPLGEIAKYIGLGKAKFRLAIGWLESNYSYILKTSEDRVLSHELIDVPNEAFFLLNKGVKCLSELLGVDIGSEVALFVRRLSGIHEVYIGPKLLCKLKFETEGLKPTIMELSEVPDYEVFIDSILKTNYYIIRTYEELSRKFILRHTEDADVVVVPWSGGKDSTTVLKLTIDSIGKDNVYAVYVDTGVDFKYNLDYLEKVSRILGISYVYLRAPIREFIVLRSNFPTHEERWCTWLKKRAIREFISKEFKGSKVVVVLGDRDGESPSRSKKGFVEHDEGLINIYPIKLWGSTHVQSYLISKGLGLNELYVSGFYRIGCYICPSLRSWEFFIMKTTGILDEIIEEPLAREYLMTRKLRLNREDI